jgi:hypothetical protein
VVANAISRCAGGVRQVAQPGRRWGMSTGSQPGDPSGVATHFIVPAGLSIEATAAPSSVDHCFITLVNVFVFDWVDAQVPVCMQVLCCSWQLERHWPAFWADSQPESQRLLRKLHVYFDGSAGCCAQAAPAARTNTTAAQSDRRICLSSTKSQPPDLRERRFHGGAGVPPTGTITPIA